MFKIPGKLPLKTSSIEEITDFVEWECVKHSNISLLEALRPILYASDEVKVLGINDDTDVIIGLFDDISIEMERRRNASNQKYPFVSYRQGYRIATVFYNQNYWVYVYLLLSTRLNMQTNKIWRNIDGTKILEELSALAARNYFGEDAESTVFGTAERGSFEDKVNELCRLTGEGHSFLDRNVSRNAAQDDKLDIVVWKNFRDKKRSKLLGFGQCKTGTAWDDAATIELQPAEFCSKWCRDMPVSIPVKLFFSSQYFPLDDYSKSKNAGIVFDRFRILDFLPSLNRELFEKLKLWSKSAIHGSKN